MKLTTACGNMFTSISGGEASSSYLLDRENPSVEFNGETTLNL